MKNDDALYVNHLRIDLVYASYKNNDKIIIDVYERSDRSEPFTFITREYANKNSYKDVPLLQPNNYAINKFVPNYPDVQIDLDTDFTGEELAEFDLLKEQYRIDTETDDKSQFSNFIPIICLLGIAMLTAL